MIKQIYFYLTKEEENDFLQYVISLDYKIATINARTGENCIISIYDKLNENLKEVNTCYILIDNSIDDDSKLDRLSFIKSNVLEFVRTYLHKEDKILRHGRLYLNMWNHKDKQIIKVYEIFKKVLNKKFTNYDYNQVKFNVSPEIIKKLENGEIKELTCI